MGFVISSHKTTEGNDAPIEFRTLSELLSPCFPWLVGTTFDDFMKSNKALSLSFFFEAQPISTESADVEEEPVILAVESGVLSLSTGKIIISLTKGIGFVMAKDCIDT